jgi:cation diffusion facilitator family transporter
VNANMSQDLAAQSGGSHSHVFLGAEHSSSERRTWAVIWLCGAMMLLEIAGGWLFGSIALIADGLHMSTHAGALLLAALAYTFSRRHAENSHFTFGSGKFGDLAGFSSAIILAMIALLIGYEAVSRIFAPVPIHFAEAIPIACLGLGVNVASAVLLSAGGHGHLHGHGHAHGQEDHGDEPIRVETELGQIALEIFEKGAPPHFRLKAESGDLPAPAELRVETDRGDGQRQAFSFVQGDGYLESVEAIPEPHDFVARLHLASEIYPLKFSEHAHGHGAAHRDNNLRAAVIHVMADAAVSVLVIGGLLLARAFGWLWMDPLAGIVGACVIASWSYGLVRDTGAILLDVNPDKSMSASIRQVVASGGDEVTDFHLWRLGPGHLGAIVSVMTAHGRSPDYYRSRLAQFSSLSHLTVEVSSATPR